MDSTNFEREEPFAVNDGDHQHFFILDAIELDGNQAQTFRGSFSSASGDQATS
jgi:hypothetical protein